MKKGIKISTASFLALSALTPVAVFAAEENQETVTAGVYTASGFYTFDEFQKLSTSEKVAVLQDTSSVIVVDNEAIQGSLILTASDVEIEEATMTVEEYANENGVEFTENGVNAPKFEVESVSAINETTVEVTLAEEPAEGVEVTADLFTVKVGEETIEVTDFAVEGTTVTLTVNLAEKAGILTVNGFAAEEEIDFVTPDNEIPVITVDSEAAVDVAFGAEFTVPTATVTDNVPQEIEATVVITNSDNEVIEAIDTRVPDTYTITYTAVDAAGNKADVQEVVVTVAPAVAVTSLERVTTSSIVVDLTGAATGLTADNFILAYLPEGKTDAADLVELTDVTVTENEDNAGEYTITFADLAGVAGEFFINTDTTSGDDTATPNTIDSAFDYTTEGVAEAVEAVNTAVGSTALDPEVVADALAITAATTGTLTALQEAALNLNEVIDAGLIEDYVVEISKSLTNTYDRLVAAIERVNAGVEEAQAELLKAVNDLDLTSNEDAIAAALDAAGATVLEELVITYFDEIEAIEFTTLDQVVAKIDGINKAETEKAVKAAEDAAKASILTDTAIVAAGQAVTDAEAILEDFVLAYELDTVYTDFVTDYESATDLATFVATFAEEDQANAELVAKAIDRLTVVEDKVALHTARLLVLNTAQAEKAKEIGDRTGTPVFDELEGLAVLTTALDADTLDVANEEFYVEKVGSLTDNATIVNIQNAVIAANAAADADALEGEIQAVLDALDATDPEAVTVTNAEDLTEAILALTGLSETTVVKVANEDDYAQAIYDAELDPAKTTVADIETIVNKVNADVTKGLVADVLEAAKANPFVAESLISDTADGTASLELLVADVNDATVFTSTLVEENEADYATALAKLADTATAADIAAVVYEVNTVVDFTTTITALATAIEEDSLTTELTNARALISEITLANDLPAYTNLAGLAKNDVAELVALNAPKNDSDAIEFTSLAQVLEVINAQVAAQPALVAEVNNAETIAQVIAALNKVDPAFKALTTAVEKENVAEGFLVILKGDATADPVVAPKTFVSLSEVRSEVTDIIAGL